MSAVKGCDTFDGHEAYFSVDEDARAWGKMRKKALHQKYCVDIWTPSVYASSLCLCGRSGGKQECAHHHYARTVTPHKLSECTIGSDENVGYQDIDIN